MDQKTRDSVATIAISDTQAQIVQLLVAGRSNKEIAHELNMCVRNVEKHLTHLYQTMGVASRTQAVAWALRRQIRS